MGASQSVEPDAPLREIEDPEPEPEEDLSEDEDYLQDEDIHWLLPFI